VGQYEEQEMLLRATSTNCPFILSLCQLLSLLSLLSLVAVAFEKTDVQKKLKKQTCKKN
jgi:hypothetical protein